MLILCRPERELEFAEWLWTWMMRSSSPRQDWAGRRSGRTSASSPSAAIATTSGPSDGGRVKLQLLRADTHRRAGADGGRLRHEQDARESRCAKGGGGSRRSADGRRDRGSIWPTLREADRDGDHQLTGTPEEMARQHAEACYDSAREMIRARCDLALRSALRQTAGDADDGALPATCRRSTSPAHEDYSPRGLRGVHGARGRARRVSPEELLIGNGYTDYIDVLQRRAFR
jgi:hypothetical protein